MFAALTVRRLKPGSYDDWRKAWLPGKVPEGTTKIYILRKVGDPDEVIAFGFWEGDDPSAMRDDPEFEEMQQQRQAGMAPHVESTGADGLYEVVEELNP